MSLMKKLLLPLLCSLLIIGFVSLYISYRALSNRGQAEIKTLKTTMIAEKEQKLKNLVEVAYNILETVNSDIDLSEAERKKQALKLIKAIRYNSTDYFWINDMSPRPH